MKHIFISATSSIKEQTTIYRCYNESLSFKQYDLIIVENNKLGLSKLYNQIIEKYKSSFDYIHFIHDDAYIYDDIQILCNIIERNNYDISGIAGAGKINISYPSGWYDMASKVKCPDIKGKIEHYYINEDKSSYLLFNKSQLHGKCVIVDGVYMCIKTTNLKEWKFNENYTFHHYDLASCLDAIKCGLSVGVVNIHLKHELVPKPIILHDPIWIESDRKFLAEYKK